MKGAPLAIALLIAAVSAAATSSGTARFPTGTFLTKITTTDLFRVGHRDYNDAHWETLTFRTDGTWRDVWFHSSIHEPASTGRYVVSGETLRLLPTPDVVRWRYAGGRLTFSIVHVPDAMGRLVYTAHAWQKIR